MLQQLGRVCPHAHAHARPHQRELVHQQDSHFRIDLNFEMASG